MIALTWDQVCAWRLAGQSLDKPAPPDDLLRVVSSMGGAQAQVMSAAELALSARVRGLKSADVQRALWEDRTLVKSWFMRGTLHIITAADYALYAAGFGTLKHFRRESWLRYFQVTSDEMDGLISGFDVVLSDKGITRDQLATAIAEHLKVPHLRDSLLSGWGTLLKPGSFQGKLCFGPSDGQNVTFVRPTDWIGAWEALEPNAALAEIARRFLRAYGPATVEEFARWFGFAVSNARKVFKSLGSEIAPVNVEGWSAAALVSMTDAPPELDGFNVRLLPHFDPYTLAVAKHVDYLMPAQHKGLVYRPQGWIMPVVIVNGRIAGVWEQDANKKRTLVTVTMFGAPDDKTRSGIAAEAERLGHFNDSPVELVYS